MPRWADVVLVPLISLLLAALISAAVILAIGENPWEALRIMVTGAVGSTAAGATRSTTRRTSSSRGLAVAVAFHARLFNIGGEGQAAIGGLGVALAALYVPWPHWSVALSAAWRRGCSSARPGRRSRRCLQAKRGSHIVITTIMFNFIAAALLNYLLVGRSSPRAPLEDATAPFPDGPNIPSFRDIFPSATPIPVPRHAREQSLLRRPPAAFLCGAPRSGARAGLRARAFGSPEGAARYSGSGAPRIIMVVHAGSSGAPRRGSWRSTTRWLRTSADPGRVEGAGFIGIAVAPDGAATTRSWHPARGVLFGILYQGGAILGMDTNIPREMIVVIQALVILFTGALDNMVRMPVERLFRRRGAKPPLSPPGPALPGIKDPAPTGAPTAPAE
jgi:simple sugar transport system permease protein